MLAKSRLLLGNLRVLSGNQFFALLESHGFFQVSQKGSHIVMQLRSADNGNTVPVLDHREIRIGTLMSIIR